MKCSIRECEDGAVSGTPLCKQHLDQIDEVRATAAEVAADGALLDGSDDEYAELVKLFTSQIAASDQMMNLAAALVHGGARDASESFPGLKCLTGEALEQLVSFLAVNVVSSVIQERANLLARAALLAKVLPTSQAEGINRMIEIELDMLDMESKDM